MDDKLAILMKECGGEMIELMWEALMAMTKRMRHIGLNDHTDAVEWFSVAKDEVGTILNLLVAESEERERAIMDECISLLKRAQEYCEALRIPMEPHGQNEETSLIDEKKLLKKRLEEYEVLLQAKRKEIKLLQKRNIAVAKVLNEQALTIDVETIPTEKQLHDLLCEIEKREMKRFELEETFIKTRERIIKIVNEFEIRPTAEFQKKVVEESVEKFVLSMENMKLLEEYNNNVTRLSNTIIRQVEELRLKVRSLWDMLSEDIKTCDEFIRRHPGSSNSTLEAFRNEAQRCDDLRKANIGQFIKKLRMDIAVMWEKCHLSQEDRDNFKYFNDTFYNEDLLELHERELEQRKNFYNENKNILVALEEHKMLWTKLERLEENANNPSRLCNRGGQLLKEEKERNMVQRKLPSVEADLISLAEAYESNHSIPFRSFGRTIQQIVDSKYENREQEKQMKLSARKVKKMDLTPGPSCTMSLARSRLTPDVKSINLIRSRLTPDVKSTIKRRILSPKNATTSKKSRIEALYHQRDRQKGALINKQITMNSNKRKNFREKARRLSDLIKINQNQDEAYNEFSVQLSKSFLRSTLLANESEEVLAVPLVKTPKKSTRTKSPCVTPKSKAANKLTIASNKKILL